MSAFDQTRRRSEIASETFAQPPFAALRDAGAPSVLVQGSGLRLLWANLAAARLLDASDYDGVQRRFEARGSSFPRTLSDLSRTLVPHAPARLVRLRFTSGSRVQNLTALCGRGDDLAGEAMFMLAFLGPEAEGLGRRSSWTMEIGGTPAPLPDADGLMLVGSASLAPAPLAPPEPVVAEAESSSLESRREDLRAVLGGSAICRFAWQTDAAGALREIDRSLMERLGLPFRVDPSQRLVEQIAAFDPTGADRVATAIAERTTWGGVSLLCPVLDGSAALPVGFAASPQFDAARAFQGFRGFCRFDLALLRLRSRPAESVVDTEPPAPSEPLPEVHASEPDVPPADIAVVSPPASLAEPGPASDNDRSANVVQLWPVHTPSAPRAPYQAMRSASLEGAGAFPPKIRDVDTTDGDLRSRIEAAVGQSLDVAGSLSTSEHQAFKEIGRALGPGPRRAKPLPPPNDAVAPIPAATPPSRDAASDLVRHAASLVETTSAGLLVVRNRRVTFANDALRAILRFHSHSDMLDALALSFARVAPPDGTQSDMSLQLASADGEDVAFTGSAQAMIWNDAPAQLWTISPDTLTRPAESAASETEAAQPPVVADQSADPMAVLDVSGEAIAVIDREGRILRLNSQAERYFGRERDAMAGEAFTELLAAESRAAATALFEQTRADAKPRAHSRGECVGRSASGASLPLEIRVARLEDSRFAVIWRDLSGQRGLERELAQARRQAARVGDQQPEFLANVSHQVRSPLNAILGFAEIMIDERFGPLGNPRYKDYLNDIHASGTQVIAIIDDLMDLSRIETGRLDLRLGAVDINKVIVDCVADAHALAHRERVIVRTSFGSRLPPVVADERSAHQIIGNLLSNAIKFNEPGGQVIVSTASADGASVVVRIRDTGIGMSDNDIAAALEPFRQLAPTKNASGTGLGLPLTKALVGANGASFSMRSRPNEGTMVEVTFQATVSAPTRVPA